jgi:hypothetical protein
MLSKKRQILFEVLGRRGQSQPTRAPVEPPPRRAARPARPAKASRAASGRKRSWSLPELQLGRKSWWIGFGVVALSCTLFVAHRVTRDPGGASPVLQRNADAGGSPNDESAYTFTICALTQDFRNPTEKRLAREKVQETVDFLGYHPNPDFHDVRGEEIQGKDAGSGTFRVYVGSAARKTELEPLRERLSKVVWKDKRPFSRATVKAVERTAAPQQGTPHER